MKRLKIEIFGFFALFCSYTLSHYPVCVAIQHWCQMVSFIPDVQPDSLGSIPIRVVYFTIRSVWIGCQYSKNMKKKIMIFGGQKIRPKDFSRNGSDTQKSFRPFSEVCTCYKSTCTCYKSACTCNKTYQIFYEQENYSKKINKKWFIRWRIRNGVLGSTVWFALFTPRIWLIWGVR